MAPTRSDHQPTTSWVAGRSTPQGADIRIERGVESSPEGIDRQALPRSEAPDTRESVTITLNTQKTACFELNVSTRLFRCISIETSTILDSSTRCRDASRREEAATKMEFDTDELTGGLYFLYLDKLVFRRSGFQKTLEMCPVP
jgi:formylmethanofuran:tetrahydromethanopterin formyltransferase